MCQYLILLLILSVGRSWKTEALLFTSVVYFNLIAKKTKIETTTKTPSWKVLIFQTRPMMTAARRITELPRVTVSRLLTPSSPSTTETKTFILLLMNQQVGSWLNFFIWFIVSPSTSISQIWTNHVVRLHLNNRRENKKE